MANTIGSMTNASAARRPSGIEYFIALVWAALGVWLVPLIAAHFPH